MKVDAEQFVYGSVLKLIFTNKNLKFNRIDKVNDQLESRLFHNEEIAKLVYVSCFSKDEEKEFHESVPMWKLYGKDESGVCIRIELSEENFAETLIDKEGTLYNPTDIPIQIWPHQKENEDWYATFDIRDVIYNHNILIENPISLENSDLKKGVQYDLRLMGASKREEWAYENECRMVSYLRTVRNDVEIPNIHYLLVPINFEKISKVEIIFSPWMNDESKTEAKQFMDNIKELKGKVSLRNSVLTGEVREL